MLTLPSATAASLLLLINHLEAHIISTATPTGLSKPDADGWTPKPTDPPTNYKLFGYVDVRDIFARQNDEQVCGYIDGIFTESVWCNAGYACGYDVNPNYAMCCSTGSAGTFITDCPAATICEEYLGVYTQTYVTTIDDTVWCPSASPYCMTAIYNGKNADDTLTYSAYVCTTESSLFLEVYPTTFSDDPGASTGLSSTVPIVPSTTTPVPIPVTTSFSSSTTSPTPTSSSTQSSFSASSCSSTGSSFGTSAGKSGCNDNDNHSVGGDGHSDKGAIAGGVVGALAVIALIGGGIFYLARRKRKQRQAAVPEIGQAGFN